MPTFKDQNNRDWVIALDGPLIREVRASSLKLDPISGDTYERVAGDPLLLGDLLAILCRSQFAAHGISPDDFAKCIRGDVCDAALKAYLDAILDFSPSSQREILRATAARVEQVRARGMEMILEKINSPEFEDKLIKALAARMETDTDEALMSLKSATSTPES